LLTWTEVEAKKKNILLAGNRLLKQISTKLGGNKICWKKRFEIQIIFCQTWKGCVFEKINFRNLIFPEILKIDFS
jgi:hypothetical protein